jgi:hypothetical protein
MSHSMDTLAVSDFSYPQVSAVTLHNESLNLLLTVVQLCAALIRPLQ